MKSLKEIKNEVFNEPDYMIRGDIDWVINKVAKRYALEVAIEALKNAAENAQIMIGVDRYKEYFDDYGIYYHSDKESILSENNIPELI